MARAFTAAPAAEGRRSAASQTHRLCISADSSAPEPWAERFRAPPRRYQCPRRPPRALRLSHRLLAWGSTYPPSGRGTIVVAFRMAGTVPDRRRAPRRLRRTGGGCRRAGVAASPTSPAAAYSSSCCNGLVVCGCSSCPRARRDLRRRRRFGPPSRPLAPGGTAGSRCGSASAWSWRSSARCCWSHQRRADPACRPARADSRLTSPHGLGWHGADEAAALAGETFAGRHVQ